MKSTLTSVVGLALTLTIAVGCSTSAPTQRPTPSPTRIPMWTPTSMPTATATVEGTVAIREVTFEELFTSPAQYGGIDILLEGFYFQGFETIVLSEKLECSGLAEGHLWPQGRMVWIEGGVPREVYDQALRQDMMGPTERYGKLRIKGKFEYGARYGHLGSFNSQIVPSETELLAWSPPPEQSEPFVTELKYRLIEHFGGVLVADPVGVPDHVRKEQAQRAFSTIQQNDEEFQAILGQLGLEEKSEFTEEQQILVFEEKRKLNAVRLEPSRGGYVFGLVIQEGREWFEVDGTINGDGKIAVLNKKRAVLPN